MQEVGDDINSIDLLKIYFISKIKERVDDNIPEEWEETMGIFLAQEWVVDMGTPEIETGGGKKRKKTRGKKSKKHGNKKSHKKHKKSHKKHKKSHKKSHKKRRKKSHKNHVFRKIV